MSSVLPPHHNVACSFVPFGRTGGGCSSSSSCETPLWTLLCGHLDGDAYTIPPPGSLWLACLGAVLVQEQESPLRRSTMAPVGVGCVLRLACRHDGSRCGARGLREKRRIVSPIRSPRRVSRATFTGYARSAWFFSREPRRVRPQFRLLCCLGRLCPWRDYCSDQGGMHSSSTLTVRRTCSLDLSPSDRAHVPHAESGVHDEREAIDWSG